MKYCFGIDVGGTTVKCGLFDETCTLLEKWELITDKSDNGANIIGDIALTIKDKLLEKKIDFDSVIGVGIDVPGPVLDQSILVSCANIGFGRTDIRSSLMAELKKLCGREYMVIVENDANAAALGEYTAGGGKAYKSLVMITLGTGVGGGVVIDGKIISGVNGAAGEIGHMPVVYGETEYCNCGKKGCLEQVASATGIVRVAKRKVSKERISEWTYGEELTAAKPVFDAMANGDKEAEAVIDEVCEYLAIALAHITCVINPEALVIGGGVSKAGEVLINKISKYYIEKAFLGCRDTEIVLAKLGNDAGIYGSARLALNRYI